MERKKMIAKAGAHMTDAELESVSGGLDYEDFDDDVTREMVCPWCQRWCKPSQFEAHVDSCPKKPADAP